MSNINDVLYEMTEYQVGRKSKSSNPMGKLNLGSKNKNSNVGSSGNNANVVLKNINKAPEAMVKITGNSKDISKISSHISYISRNGELEVKNQDGETLKGADELKGELQAWESLGITKEDGKARESLHVIFSMPNGTDPKGLLKAVEQFAQQELYDNNYMYAQHLDTKNPHVHLCVSVRDKKGNRLNPRKGDIANWRKLFAEKLREQGISAVATTRQQRMKVHKGYSQTVKHIDGKHQKTGQLSYVTSNRLKEINEALSGIRRLENPYDEQIKKGINRISVNYGKILNDKNNGLDKDTLANIKKLLDGYKESKDFLTRNELLLEKIGEKTKLKDKSNSNVGNKEGKDHDR